ncbi:MAG: hypothetical protein HY821_20220 [Acidobacteria bacterium]|nr:hypothetical protein [Acidobacteriota bacterium]
MSRQSSDSSRTVPVDPEKRLNSWKEIAAELGVGVRSAQLYEANRGLPVQRDGARVSITLGALREWQAGRYLSPRADEPPPRPTSRWWAAAAIVLFLLAASSLYFFTRPAPDRQPATLKWTGAILNVFAGNSTPLWQHKFPYPILFEVAMPFPHWIGDLDADGNNEVLTFYPHNRREDLGWDLFCFSSTGALRWQFGVQRTVASSRRAFSPPYVLRDFTVFPSPEKDRTFWAAAVFVHHVLSPAVLVVLDSTGKSRGELWQDGHLNMVRALDLDGDGVSEILAGGIQEIPAQASLIVVDPRSASGAARTENDSNPRQLINLGPGTEKATVYFPRTKLNRLVDPFNYVVRLGIVNGTIQASVVEHIGGPQGYLVYTLAPTLAVMDLAVPDALVKAVRSAHTGPDSYPTTPAALQEMKSRVRVVRWKD